MQILHISEVVVYKSWVSLISFWEKEFGIKFTVHYSTVTCNICVTEWLVVVPGDPKKVLPFECKMHSKKEVFKIQTFFNYQ